MADKSISELVAATAVGSTDLFVLEQTGTAKKLTGQILENWLVSFADGHGGIQTLAKTGTSGLVDTYTITYADTTTSTFTVTNGKALTSITQYWAVSSSGSNVPSTWYTTRQTMTTTDKYLWSYMTFNYNDGTSSDSTKSVVGVYGDTGAQTYVWIKYAAVEPTSDADMGDTPDNWIGIYTGLSSTAPTSYTAYAWYEYKGEKGDTGDASTITSQSVTYLESSSGTVVPSGSWTTNVPTVTPGNFLWTRTILTFNDYTTTTAYSVSRYGIDGTGSVSSVNSISPDTNGNVALTATNIPTSDNTSVQAHIDNLTDNYLPLTAGGGKPLTGTLSIYRADNSPGLVLKNGLADMSGTESATRAWFLYCQDKDGDLAGFFSANHTATGRGSVAIAASNISNGSAVSNALELRMEQDGTRSVAFTSPAAWCDALGLGTSGVLPITIAQGGSGQTGVESSSTASNVITGSSGVTINGAAYAKWGKVVQIYVDLKSTSAISASSWTTVGTIVSDLRPRWSTGGSLVAPCVAANIIIESNGNLRLKGAISANTTITIGAIYIIP